MIYTIQCSKCTHYGPPMGPGCNCYSKKEKYDQTYWDERVTKYSREELEGRFKTLQKNYIYLEDINRELNEVREALYGLKALKEWIKK